MANVIQLTDNYVATSSVYDTNQSKTQADINSSVSSSITTINSNFSALSSMYHNAKGGGKGIYAYSKWVDNSSSTSIKITSTSGYQVLVGLIFTRYAVMSFRIGSDSSGNLSCDALSAIVGSNPISWSASGKTVTMTVGSWESFTMLFTSHAGMPTFA